ncbi:MAG TPA: hypothetical protein VL133_09140, partial [Devosia sp.]|nr:hypothetical protein [Devosia sp.]
MCPQFKSGLRYHIEIVGVFAFYKVGNTNDFPLKNGRWDGVGTAWRHPSMRLTAFHSFQIGRP